MPAPGGGYDPSCYVERRGQAEAQARLRGPRSPVALYGPYRFGKRTLLGHLLFDAQQGPTPARVLHLDLSTLGLSPAGRRLAEALQRYGMFCVDNSSDSSVIGEELSARGQSWTGLLSYDDQQRLPTDRLRVLKLRNKTPIR